MTVISDIFTKNQDERIRRDVTHQIGWQPEIHSRDISVKVVDSCVTLTGFVHSYFEKLAASRAAKAVFGVVSIANDIEVKPASERTDPEIARDIAQAFKMHTGVPDPNIAVSVSGGVVTLEGALDWHYEMENAEMAVYVIDGVRSIVNRMTIKPTVSTQVVREKIEEAWRRLIDLDTRSISVVANDRTVSLYGTVHSWSERERAERAAWQAPGVQRVENHMIIHP